MIKSLGSKIHHELDIINQSQFTLKSSLAQVSMFLQITC